MKVLVDTNVLLSAALRDRLPEQVVLHVATSWPGRANDSCQGLPAPGSGLFSLAAHRPEGGRRVNGEPRLPSYTGLVRPLGGRDR
jgi:hypothetical protein